MPHSYILIPHNQQYKMATVIWNRCYMNSLVQICAFIIDISMYDGRRRKYFNSRTNPICLDKITLADE
jgi:hypothetical protein